jgi:hypothetical protein
VTLRKLLSLGRYPSLAVFLVMALCAVAFAWITFGLLHLAMSNAEFLITYRLAALMDGGLLQAGELALRGLVALVAYLGFKGCEAELVARWRGKDK